MPGKLPAEACLQNGNEKSPLLGQKNGKQRNQCFCSGLGPLAITSIVLVAILLICTYFGVSRRIFYTWGSESLPNKGRDFFEHRERFLTPASPSQPPPQVKSQGSTIAKNVDECKTICQRFGMKALGSDYGDNPIFCSEHCDVVFKKPLSHVKPGLPPWPERHQVEEHPPHVVVANAPEKPSEPPARLKSGNLEAHIRYKNHPPSWHTLRDTDAFGLGVQSRPLFSVLSGDASKSSISSKDCDVSDHDQNDAHVELRLSCPNDIEAIFSIQAPSKDSVGYFRTSVELWSKSSTWPEHLSTLRLLDALVQTPMEIKLTGAESEPGLPVVVGDRFFVGGEHPMAITAPFHARHNQQGVFIDIRHLHSLLVPTQKKPWRFGAVIGLIPEGSQARRTFVNYIHSERPGRRTPMVHYNSWFDFTGWQDGFNTGVANVTDTMSETSCVQRVREFGENLVRKHNVKMDSYLIDDGWDNTNTLWEFDSNKFPRGLKRVAEVAHEYDSGVGIWLSPWGGYGDSKKNRVREGKARGFEIKTDPWGEEAFDLAGKKYGAWFFETAEMMRRDQGVNMFKFDGTSRVPQEMEAMLGMVGQIRKVKVKRQKENEDDEEDEIWINLTTGTWPSPFFLFWADSIWRGDGDVGPYPGKESMDGLSQRQKWIRWRAEKVQQHVVDQSAFFPLSQLMIHGVVLAGHGDALYTGLGESTDAEFAQEIWSFVGMGLQLQELYISPSRMTTSMWTLLAEGLAWSSKNVKVLMDTHWAFGRVDRRQVFCMASWDPQQGYGFVMLQNGKGDRQASEAFDLASVLELPNVQAHKSLEVSIVKSVPGISSKWSKTNLSSRLQSCRGGSQLCHINASKKTRITLQHTEVLVLEVRLA